MAAPKILCDTAGMSEKDWLAARMHGPLGDIPYTVGGSDVAAIFGLSPWMTPLELWKIKKGQMKTPQKANSGQLEMGHLLEPIAAHWYAKKTGYTVIDDTNLYQHASHPYALANFDRRFIKPTGEPGILECKSLHKRKSRFAFTTRRLTGLTTPSPSTMSCSCGSIWQLRTWSMARSRPSGATTRMEIWPCRKSPVTGARRT